jgi:hypothetical protein
MVNEAAGHTLQPTALVGEVRHFFAPAAEAMRRILMDNARRKRALRHGGRPAARRF